MTPESPPGLLSGVLAEFREAHGALTLTEVARRLEVERSALDGMIELLVRKSRLRKIGPDGGVCSICGEEGSCAALAAASSFGTRYELVGPDSKAT
jgi:hypothetical protein